MTTSIVKPEATATFIVDGEPVVREVSDGTVTLDDGWSPYVQASLEVPISSPEVAEAIDPRQTQRVTLDVSADVNALDARTFDLGVRARRAGHKAGTIAVDLASDEALLIDKRRLSDSADTTPRTHEASLRAIVGWALDKIGAELEAGAADADLTAYWQVTNLVTNPSFEVSAADTATGLNASGLISTALVSPSPAGGTKALRATATAAGTSSFYPAGWATGQGFRAIRVQPGRDYTAALYAVGSTPRPATVALQFRNEAGEVITSTDSATATDSSAGGQMRRYHVTAAAPENAAYASILFTSTGNTAGQYHYIDGVMLIEGTELVPYFDGSLPPAGYSASWAGDAHLSVSTRTPFVERPPALFAWKPGVALWDFLAPLLQHAALRLYCDEERVWRLVDPATHETPGYVVVQARHNATEGEDVIDRNEEGLWATGVVVVYRWTDEQGNRREAYDFAGTDEKVHTVEHENTPYPGPGAAAYLLARLEGRGRTQEVEALTTYTATPGQDVLISLPGTLPQTGKIRRVEFDVRRGLMGVQTRDLTDALPGSWAAWDPAETWAEVDDELTWEEA